MLKGIVSKAMTTILDEYMKPIKSDQIRLEALKGITELRNLEFQEKALEKLNQPLIIEHGTVKLFYLSAQFTKLETAPMIIFIEDVFLKLRLDWEFLISMSNELTGQSLYAVSKQALKKQEHNIKTGIGIVDKIIDNLRISIKNIKIELYISHNNSESVFGFELPKFDIWSEANDNKDKSFFIKKLAIEGIKFYMDCKNENEEYPEEHSNIFDLPSINLVFTHYRDFSTAIMNYLEGGLKEISLSIDKKHLMHLSSIIKHFQEVKKSKNYIGCHKPTDAENLHGMFIYANNCAKLISKQPKLDVKLALEVLKYRKKYYKLYSSTLLKSKTIFRNYAEKFNKLNKKISPKAKELLADYSKDRHNKEELENDKDIAEAERKEMNKRSELFIKSLSSLQAALELTKFTFSLKNNSKPFIEFGTLDINIRVMFSEFYKQFDFGLKKIFLNILNKHLFYQEDKKSDWFSIKLNYGEELAQVKMITEPLGINLSINDVQSIIQFFGDINFPETEFPEEAPDVTKELRQFYEAKIWDISLLVKSIPIKFDVFDHIFEFNINNFIIANNSTDAPRKLEELYLYISLLLDAKFENATLLDPIKATTTIGSIYNKETDTFETNIGVNLNKVIANFGPNILHFVQPYLPMFTAFFTSKELLNNIKYLILYISSAISFIKNITKINFNLGATNVVFGKENLNLTLGKLNSGLKFVNQSLEYVNINTNTLNISTTSHKYPFISIPSFCLAFNDKLLEINSNKIEFTILSNIIDVFGELFEVNFGEPCFDVGASIKELILSYFSLPIDLKLSINFMDIEIKIASLEKEGEYSFVSIPIVSIIGNLIKGIVGVKIPKFLFSFKDKTFLSLTETNVMLCLAYNEVMWTESTTNLIQKAMNLEYKDVISFDMIHPVIFIDLGYLDIDFSNQEISTFVTIFNEFFPLLNGMKIPEVDLSERTVKVSFFFDLRFILNKISLKISELDIGADINELKFNIRGYKEANIFFKLKEIVFNQNIVDTKIISIKEDYFLTIETSKSLENKEIYYNVNGHISPTIFNIHPAVIISIINYIAKSVIWDLRIPVITSGNFKAPKIYYELPNLRFHFDANDLVIFVPTKADINLTKDVLSLNLGFSADATWPHFEIKFFICDCRFLNIKYEVNFPDIINDLSAFLIIDVLKNEVKVNAGLDKDFCISFSVDDIISFSNIFKDWQSIFVMPEIQLEVPPIKLPTISITTKNIVLQVCEQNSNSAEKATPLIMLCINPIRFNALPSKTANIYILNIDFMCQAYNKHTGNFDVIIENNTLNLTLTMADKPVTEKSPTEESQMEANISFENPLVINVTQHILKSILDAKVNTGRCSRELMPAPEFWTKNTCNKEVSISVGDSHLFLFPGDVVPTFFISNNEEMEVYIGNNKFYFKPDDLIYPIQLTNEVFVTRHSHMNGIMIEFLTPCTIKNSLDFTIYIYIIGEKDVFFIDAVPPGEIRSLPNFLANYAFVNTGKLKKERIRKLKHYVLGPTMQSTSSESSIISKDITATIIDENGQTKDTCIIACLRDEYYLGIKVIEITSEFTIRNLIPTSMQYIINGQKVECHAGETVTIPFIEHKAEYVSITASLEGINFPPISWVYFKKEYAQPVPVDYGYLSTTPYLAVVATQNHLNGFNTSLIVYSPAVIFNSSSQIITIENSVISPGIFILWCPKEYFLRPDNVKASVKIKGRTNVLENAIDCITAGSNELILLSNKNSTLFTPLRYISRRQGGDFTRTVGITITDAMKVYNNLEKSVSFIPISQEHDIIFEDVHEFIIPENSEKVMKIISKSQNYMFSVADFSSYTVVDFSIPGEYIFSFRTKKKKLIVSMKIVDEEISTSVYLNKCYRVPFMLRNNLDVDIVAYQLKESNKVVVKSGSYEEYALENPLKTKKITIKIKEFQFVISLEEAARSFFFDKIINGKRVRVDFMYIKGQRRIIFSYYHRTNEVAKKLSSSCISFNLKSFGVSLIDRNFRELAYIGVIGINMKADIVNEKVLFKLCVDSFGVYDQNPTATKPSIIRSENKDFFELKAILPSDIIQSKEIIYLGIRVQPLHIYVSPMFISDIAQFAREINFNDISGTSGSIAPVPMNNVSALSTMVHIVWLEVFHIETHVSIHYDEGRTNFNEDSIHLFSKIPNLSERIFVLPAFFVSDVTSPLKTILQEIAGDYLVNGLDYALSNMGALGSLVKFFGAVGKIKSLLNIKHTPFQSLSKVKTIKSDESNRLNAFGCFNQYTIEFLFYNLKLMNEANPNSKEKSLCELVTTCKHNNINVRGIGLTESGLVGVVLTKPEFNEGVVPINRVRYPLCNMMNRVQLYKSQYSLSLTSLVTNGYGRALFVGDLIDYEKPGECVFITRTHICIISEETKILFATKISNIKSVSEEDGVIIFEIVIKKGEPQIIKMKSDVNSAITFFISTTKNTIKK